MTKRLVSKITLTQATISITTKLTSKCENYTDTHFKNNKAKGLSTIKANLNKNRDYLAELDLQFDMIAISEIWAELDLIKLEVQGRYLEVSQAEQEATSTDKPISNRPKKHL